MGNESTHYRVYCTYHPSVTIYSGYSKSTRDDYLRSRWANHECCHRCADERNERMRQRAEDEARAAREREAKRLEAEQRRLRLEKERQLREKREREKQEELDRQKKAKIAREKELKEMKEALQRQFDAENERWEDIQKKAKQKEPEQNKNVYSKWMKLDTYEIVKDIGERVRVCSAAGQEIIDSVDSIETELKKSLVDQYETVKPQIEKYKGYGQEMRDMNDIFVKEFDKVLNGKCKKSMDDASSSVQVMCFIFIT